MIMESRLMNIMMALTFTIQSVKMIMMIKGCNNNEDGYNNDNAIYYDGTENDNSNNKVS